VEPLNSANLTYSLLRRPTSLGGVDVISFLSGGGRISLAMTFAIGLEPLHLTKVDFFYLNVERHLRLISVSGIRL